MAEVTLGTKSYEFAELEKKYRGFMGPACKISIDGQELTKDQYAISEITVIMSTSEDIGTATFSITNLYDPETRDFSKLGNPIALGKTVEIELGYVDKLTPVFFGYIAGIRAEYSGGGPPSLKITAMDPTFKLMRGRKAASWTNKKISDVVKEIALKYGLTPKQVDATETMMDFVVQKGVSDYHFLQDLALRSGRECFIVGKEFYFRKRNQSKTPVTSLKHGESLIRFFVEASLSEQVTKVFVRGWDATKKEYSEGSSDTVDKIGSNAKTGGTILKSDMKPGSYDEYIYMNFKDATEANKIAESLMNERAMRFVQGEGECTGHPEIQAGRYIKIEQTGAMFSDVYYVKRVTHEWNTDGYRTIFEVQGNAI